MIEDQAEQQPLLTLGEARAAVQLLQRLAEQDGELADVAAELVTRIGRRLPTG